MSILTKKTIADGLEKMITKSNVSLRRVTTPVLAGSSIVTRDPDAVRNNATVGKILMASG